MACRDDVPGKLRAHKRLELLEATKAKLFALDITDTNFDWSRRQEQIDAEAALDGL